MKIKDVIQKLQEFHNQEAELILAFADGIDTIDYSFIEDSTNYSDFAYLSVNGYFDKEVY